MTADTVISINNFGLWNMVLSAMPMIFSRLRQCSQAPMWNFLLSVAPSVLQRWIQIICDRAGGCRVFYLHSQSVMLIGFCVGLLMPITAVANASSVLRYGAGIYDTQWLLSGNVFACRFEQVIPDYGRAVFIHRAGEKVAFQLESHRNLMAFSEADVRISPPPWQPQISSRPLGKVKIMPGEPTLILDSKRTNQFFHALLEGQWPAISHYTQYDRQRYVQTHVSGVRFKEFYSDYNLCAEQLLTTNFSQVSRSKILFRGGERTVDKYDIKVLDRIIYYIQNDPRITFIYIDGHADSLGRRYDNRQISKARAQSVERYFLKRGIPPEMVTARFHGSRYPIASNATYSGRAANRRVTIRLEMSDDIPIPEDLVFRLPTNASSQAPASFQY